MNTPLMYVTLPSGQMPEITPYLDTFHAVNNKIRAPSIAVSMFLCIASKYFLEDPDKHQGIRLPGYANFCKWHHCSVHKHSANPFIYRGDEK